MSDSPKNIVRSSISSTADKAPPEALDTRRSLLAALLGGVSVAALSACIKTEESADSLAPAEAVDEAVEALLRTNVCWVDNVTALAAAPTGATGYEVAVLQGYASPGDGGGGVFVWTSAVTAPDGGTVFAGSGGGSWKRLYDGALNVRWFGAKGDTTAVDNTAIANALSVAKVAGLSVYFPPGGYKVTAPIQIVWDGTALNLTGRIFGAGEASQIVGFGIPAGRAVVELLGAGNGTSPTQYLRAANIEVDNISIYQNGCDPTSFCLRVGDAMLGVLIKRLWCTGANGVSLRMSPHNNAAGFAQIQTLFQQCSISTFSAASFAVYPEIAGTPDGVSHPPALWDCVRFDSCSFNGLVCVMATLAAFESCMFTSNANFGARYGCNVEILAGSASFHSCYFEDAYANLHVCPGVTRPVLAGLSGDPNCDVLRVTATDCFFSGEVDTAGQASAMYGVWADPTNNRTIGAIELSACVFADYNYTHDVNGNVTAGASVANTSTLLKSLRIVDPINFRIIDNNNTQRVQSAPITVLGTAPEPNRTETVVFHVPGAPATPQVPVYYGSPFVTAMTVAGTNKVYAFRVSRTCWISRIKLMMDARISTLTPNTLSVVVNRNGSSVVSRAWTSFTDAHEDTTNQVSSGYVLNPAPLALFTAGQDLAVVLTNTGGVPQGTLCVVEIELAY